MMVCMHLLLLNFNGHINLHSALPMNRLIVVEYHPSLQPLLGHHCSWQDDLKQWLQSVVCLVLCPVIKAEEGASHQHFVVSQYFVDEWPVLIQSEQTVSWLSGTAQTLEK